MRGKIIGSTISEYPYESEFHRKGIVLQVHDEIDGRTRSMERLNVWVYFWLGHARSIMRAWQDGLIEVKGPAK